MTSGPTRRSGSASSRDLRPELSPAAAATAVHATFGLMNSVADFHSALDPAELGALLAAMAIGALRDVYRDPVGN